MRLPRFSLLACVLLAALPLRAVSDHLPYALEQLPGNGPAAFAKILMPRFPEEARRLGSALEGATENAGDLLDSEIVVRTRVTSRLTRIVIALHYEQRPVFLRIDRYTNESEELFLNARVLRDLDALIPDDELLEDLR